MDWIRRSKYPKLAVANFIILTFFGLLLRIMQLYPLPGVNYQFLLHAHSHFAFSGWMFFSIAILITHLVSRDTYSAAYKNVFVLALISAFGMLATFSFQGYRAASITFSTLFILVTYRFTWLALREKKLQGISGKLIHSGLIFLCISSLGPLSLAPLTIAGFRDTPVYQNAIYFYLHFQMNGFMLLTALGLFASAYLPKTLGKTGNWWLRIFIFSAVPLFLIFTLWSRPAAWVWIIALAGSLINLVSWLKLCSYFKNDVSRVSFLVKAAIVAITIKIVFQVLICIPVIGEWTFLNRNLIIGYIHLLTLGCIVPLIFDQFIKKGFLISDSQIIKINRAYIVAVAGYLALLFVQPVLSLFLIRIPCQLFFVWISFAFLVIGGLYQLRTQKSPSALS